MPTQVGCGVVWAVPGMTMTLDGVAFNVSVSELTLSAEAKTEEHFHNSGELGGQTFFDQRLALSMKVYPSGATMAAAKTNDVRPVPGTEMTITSTDDPNVAGNWSVMSMSASRTLTGKLTYDVTAQRPRTNTGISVSRATQIVS